MTTGLPRPSECRWCTQPIRFVLVETGHVPVNPLPAKNGTGTISARLVMTSAGRQLRGHVLTAPRARDPHNPLRFTPHADTCTDRPAPPPPPPVVDVPLF